jgi:hypothetical protein
MTAVGRAGDVRMTRYPSPRISAPPTSIYKAVPARRARAIAQWRGLRLQFAALLRRPAADRAVDELLELAWRAIADDVRAELLAEVQRRRLRR